MNSNKRNRNVVPDRQKLLHSYEKSIYQYEVALRKTSRKIKNLVTKYSINASIKQRLKGFESYFDKLVDQNKSGLNLKITDILGIRVICPFLEELTTIESLISENFEILEIERKGTDYSIREFGYDSIHILVSVPDDISHVLPFSKRVCEIQLRTILQEAWAEIEHELIYKANVSILSEPIKRKLASLNATLTLSDVIFQEIRDYQTEITAKREKRLEAVFDKIHTEDKISMVEVSDNDLADEMGFDIHSFSMKPKNKIEKLMFEALEAHGKGQYEISIDLYTQILNEKPDSNVRSVIYNHRGMAHFVLSQYKKAIKDFSKSVEYNSENFRALNNRGMAHRMLKNYTEALEDFNNSIELNAFQSDGYYSRALTLYDINDFTKALEDCLKVLKIKPQFEPAEKLKIIIQKKLMA